jgi:hypothetical protein
MGEKIMKKKNINLVGNLDAVVWAKEFIKIVKKNTGHELDEDWMRAWFANALMTGHDIGYQKALKRRKRKSL